MPGTLDFADSGHWAPLNFPFPLVTLPEVTAKVSLPQFPFWISDPRLLLWWATEECAKSVRWKCCHLFFVLVDSATNLLSSANSTNLPICCVCSGLFFFVVYTPAYLKVHINDSDFRVLRYHQMKSFQQYFRLFTVPYFFVRSFRYTASYRHGYLDFQVYRGGGKVFFSSPHPRLEL